MPRVTALRVGRRGRVAVELDGTVWRTLPEDAVVRARLVVGTDLEGERLRLLVRELRRSRALTLATRALHHRELSTRRLEQRLARAGVGESDRIDALATLGRSGLVDDSRYALLRAQSLAARGYGDEAIRRDLAREGVGPEPVQAALGALEREDARAERVVARRGRSPATARYLARRGFAEDAVEAAVGSQFAERGSGAYDS